MYIIELTNIRTNKKSYFFNKEGGEITTKLNIRYARVINYIYLAKAICNYWFDSIYFSAKIIDKC
jgi:hypothetical protein